MTWAPPAGAPRAVHLVCACAPLQRQPAQPQAHNGTTCPFGRLADRSCGPRPPSPPREAGQWRGSARPPPRLIAALSRRCAPRGPPHAPVPACLCVRGSSGAATGLTPPPPPSTCYAYVLRYDRCVCQVRHWSLAPALHHTPPRRSPADLTATAAVLAVTVMMKPACALPVGPPADAAAAAADFP